MTNRTTVLRTPESGRWLGWLGHRIRYLAIGEDTNNAYCISDSRVHNGGGAPPHSHDFGEAFYVLEGRVAFTAGNQTVELGQGGFVHIHGGTVHAPKVISEEGARLLTIAAPAGFDRFQFEAGEALESEDSPLTKAIDDVRSDIDKVASGYGIDMHPAESAFQTESQIHVCQPGEGELVDAVGDRYRFLAEGEHTDGRYALWHATISPGGGPPPHIHRREDEAFFVLSGEINFEADGQSFVGTAGSFVNLPIGSQHRFFNAGSQDAEVLILIAPAGLEKMFRQTGVEVTDAATPIATASVDEKQRLVAIAPEYGVELILDH